MKIGASYSTICEAELLSKLIPPQEVYESTTKLIHSNAFQDHPTASK